MVNLDLINLTPLSLLDITQGEKMKVWRVYRDSWIKIPVIMNVNTSFHIIVLGNISKIYYYLMHVWISTYEDLRNNSASFAQAEVDLDWMMCVQLNEYYLIFEEKFWLLHQT